MSESDDLDDVFQRMFRMVERLMDSPAQGGGAVPSYGVAAGRDDELIDGGDFVTYLVSLPQETGEEARVDVTEEEIVVSGAGVLKRKSLPSKVDPRTAKKAFRNGILSVRVEKL